MATRAPAERPALALVEGGGESAIAPSDAEADQLYAEALAAARRAARVAVAFEQAARRSPDPAWAEAAVVSRRAESALRIAAETVPELPAEARRRGGRAICLGSLVVDRERRVARYADCPVSLTRLEFDLLVALAERADEVVSKADLLRQVWGYAGRTLRTRTVDSHASRLRRALHRAGAPESAVENVWAVGYRLAICESPEPPGRAA
jgi:DNA-binding response OmpR family regulator